MKSIPELGNFTREGKACIIPYGAWNGPLLDYLASWRVTVLTCEQEVVDCLHGRTAVHFLPPVLTKKKEKAKKEHEIGIFGDWRNPFNEKSVQAAHKLLKEFEESDVLVRE